MSVLKNKIESLKVDIENLNLDLISKNKDLLRLQKSKEVETKELYNGLIEEFTSEIKDVKRRNNMCGFTQGDTEPYFTIKVAYIETGDVFLTKEQMNIILSYHSRENKVQDIIVNGLRVYL